jgi:predicted Zn-dependent protease
LVVYWLVRVCVAAGRYHSALRHAKDFLRKQPHNWQLRLVVASIHEALGDPDEATVQLERIVRAQPTASLPHYRLALLYDRRPLQAHRAFAHFQAYLALDPTGPHAPEVKLFLAEAPGTSNNHENDSAVGVAVVREEPR